MCKISIAYISAISKPIHFWFAPKLSAVQGLQSQLQREVPRPGTSGPTSKISTSTLKIGEGLRPLFGEGARSPLKTKSPGLRSTFIPSGILIHPAIWPQQIWAKNWGLCPFVGRGAGSSSNTMWPGPRPTCVPSFILIHQTVWPQYTNVTDRQTDRTTVR